MRALFQLILAMALLPLATPPQAMAQDENDPTVQVVSYIEVAPTTKEATATLLKQLADASRKDAGAMRFEVLQRTAPSNQFADPRDLEGPAGARRARRGGAHQAVPRQDRADVDRPDRRPVLHQHRSRFRAIGAAARSTW